MPSLKKEEERKARIPHPLPGGGGGRSASRPAERCLPLCISPAAGGKDAGPQGRARGARDAAGLDRALLAKFAA